MTGNVQLTRHNSFSQGDAISRGYSSFCRGDLTSLGQTHGSIGHLPSAM